METIILEGHLIAETPLATCPPGLASGNSQDPLPIPTMTRFINGEAVDNVPFMPASGYRGRLRTATVDFIRREIDGVEYQLKDYQRHIVGGIKGAKEDDAAAENKVDLAKMFLAREKDPVMSLWGASDPWVNGRAAIMNAIAPGPLELFHHRGVRTDPIERRSGVLGTFSQQNQDDWAAAAQAEADRSLVKRREKTLKAQIRKSTGDEKKALEKELADVEKQIKALSEKAVSTNALKMPLAGFYAIPQGAQLENRLLVRNATECEIGLFFHGLDEFYREDPILGAHAAVGCGLVSAVYNLKRKQPGKRPETIGQIDCIPYEGIKMDAGSQAYVEHCMSAFVANANAGEFDLPGAA